MSFFSAEDLIIAVMERPALWDANDPGHHNKEVCNTMWTQIKRESRAHSVESLKKKWKNLKDQYRKELKKMPLPISGSTTKFKSTWKHFDMMSFMLAQTLPRQSLCNVDAVDAIDIADMADIGDTDDIADIVDQTPDDEQVQDEDQLMPYAPAYASSLTPSEASSRVVTKKTTQDLREEFLKIQRKKLKLQEKQQREKRKRELMRAKECRDEDYHYVMTLLPQMRTFTPAQKFRVRNKINSVMLAELERHEQLMD